MSWTTFHCNDPDFVVRSIPANVQYGVRRSCLVARSEVFSGFFFSFASGGVVLIMPRGHVLVL
jgi:hypothetical protein